MAASGLIGQAAATENLATRLSLLAAALDDLLRVSTDDVTVAELLPRLLHFRFDRNVAIRKWVVKLIEQSAKCRPAHLPAMMEALRDLSVDSDEKVTDAVVLSMAVIYPAAFGLLCSSDNSWRHAEFLQMWRTARRSHLPCRASLP